MIFTECSITIKTESTKLVNRYPIYDVFVFDPQSHPLKEMIEETISNCHLDPSEDAPSIVVKAKMIVQS